MHIQFADLPGLPSIIGKIIFTERAACQLNSVKAVKAVKPFHAITTNKVNSIKATVIVLNVSVYIHFVIN